MEEHKHIVNFNKWCKKCISKDCSEDDYNSPCPECLDYAWNYGTDQPQLFEPKDKDDKENS